MPLAWGTLSPSSDPACRVLLIRLLSLLLPPLALLAFSGSASVSLTAWALVPVWLCVPLYGLLLGGSWSVAGAFGFGLLIDVVLYGTLGVWALALGIPTLALRLGQQRSLGQPLWIQLVGVAAVLVGSNVLLFRWLDWLHAAPLNAPWAPVLVATLLWAPLAHLAERPEAGF